MLAALKEFLSGTVLALLIVSTVPLLIIGCLIQPWVNPGIAAFILVVVGTLALAVWTKTPLLDAFRLNPLMWVFLFIFLAAGISWMANMR